MFQSFSRCIMPLRAAIAPPKTPGRHRDSGRGPQGVSTKYLYLPLYPYRAVPTVPGQPSILEQGASRLLTPACRVSLAAAGSGGPHTARYPPVLAPHHLPLPVPKVSSGEHQAVQTGLVAIPPQFDTLHPPAISPPTPHRDNARYPARSCARCDCRATKILPHVEATFLVAIWSRDP